MVIPSTKMREHPMNCMQEGRSIVPFPKILAVTGISFSPIDVYKRQAKGTVIGNGDQEFIFKGTQTLSK